MNGHKMHDPEPVISRATVSADAIAVGDLLWADSGNSYAPRPASAYTWDTNLLTTQTSFKLVFLGVALSAKKVGSTDPVRIGTVGEYEMDCASATFNLGDIVGPAKASGNALENQKLVSVAIAGGLGRVTKAVTTAATKVQARLQSSLIRGVAT